MRLVIRFLCKMMGIEEGIYLPTPIYMGNKNITLVDELGDND